MAGVVKDSVFRWYWHVKRINDGYAQETDINILKVMCLSGIGM